MKKLKTFLGFVIFALIIYFVLTLIMPKIAFSQKKALLDSYKVAKEGEDTKDMYSARYDMSKGTWESLEYDLRLKGYEVSEKTEYWTKLPNTGLFTKEELKGFEKEYVRKTTKSLPIQEKYFTEYIAVLKDENGYKLYYELQMKDADTEPLSK